MTAEILVYRDGKVVKKLSLGEGRYIIGRPPEIKEEDILRGSQPLNVNLYNIKREGRETITELDQNSVVSRDHLELVIGPEKITLGDHGYKGKGSAGGTYVTLPGSEEEVIKRIESGELLMIKKGRKVDVKLSEDQCIGVSLGMADPEMGTVIIIRKKKD